MRTLATWLLVSLFYGLFTPPSHAQQSPASDSSGEITTALDAEIAKWEPDIAALEAVQAEENPDAGGIVFYGSSSIRRWDSIATDMSPWPVIQRGYGGAKLSDAVHYAPRILGPHLGPDNPKRCRAIVVFVANDIVGNRNADGELTGNDPTPDVVTDRFAQLTQYVRSVDRDVPLFWIEVTPCLSRWHVWPTIEATTQKIRQQIDDDPNSFFIPTAGAFLTRSYRPEQALFVEDQLHLNATGYALWANLIKSNLHPQLAPAIPYPTP
jgi:hypothetical protein